jgi:ribosomal protein L18E
MPPAFEGGQTPLWKRVPKRGFKNPHRKSYAFVNVGQLNERFADGAEITPKILEEQGIIKKFLNGVKILGDGPLSKRLIVKAHKFSKSAKEKIIAAGGQAIALLPEKEQSAPPAAPEPAVPTKTEIKTAPAQPEKTTKKAAPAKAGEPKEKKPAKPKTPKKSEEKSGK